MVSPFAYLPKLPPPKLTTTSLVNFFAYMASIAVVSTFCNKKEVSVFFNKNEVSVFFNKNEVSVFFNKKEVSVIANFKLILFDKVFVSFFCNKKEVSLILKLTFKESLEIFDNGLFSSLVLSTLLNPTSVFVKVT